MHQHHIHCNITYFERARVVEIADIKTDALKLGSNFRAAKLEPYRDKKGLTYPINDIREIIPAANRYLRRCVEMRAFKTYLDGVSEEKALNVVIPDGLHVFDIPSTISVEIASDALLDIKHLFKRQIVNRDHGILMLNPNSRPTNTILFYSRDGPQPSFLEVLQCLYYEAPSLARYIVMYCAVFMQLLKIDEGQLHRAQISLVHYDSLAGLNPHIDSIHQFEDTMGPIFTIAMGNDEKMFDMLPTLIDGTPVRIYSQPNQFTVMDGMSRVGWSHGLPWGCELEQWTVAVKFPGIVGEELPLRFEEFHYNGVVTRVPYYL